MRPINVIIIHCSATRPDQDIGAAQIRDWHVTGNNWSDIGYHIVIRRDGTVESGRPLALPGAHCSGHNNDSIGICLVGGIAGRGPSVPENNFTTAQWRALEDVVQKLRQDFPGATVHGHNEFAAKACPCFDVRDWLGETPFDQRFPDRPDAPEQGQGTGLRAHGLENRGAGSQRKRP